jgi:hypothetical protein
MWRKGKFETKMNHHALYGQNCAKIFPAFVGTARIKHRMLFQAALMK